MTTPTKPHERPVNLRDWEVRAILAGTKTQLRIPLDLPSHWSFPPARVDAVKVGHPKV